MFGNWLPTTFYAHIILANIIIRQGESGFNIVVFDPNDVLACFATPFNYLSLLPVSLLFYSFSRKDSC